MKKHLFLLSFFFIFLLFVSAKLGVVYATPCVTDSTCSSGQECTGIDYTGNPPLPIPGSGTCTDIPKGWGSAGSGPSLNDVGNLLGPGAPSKAPVVGWAKLTTTAISLLILSAIILSLFYLIWGGVDWIMSEGDKQRLGNAKQKIIFSIIGLTIVFVSFLIINILSKFFKIS